MGLFWPVAAWFAVTCIALSLALSGRWVLCVWFLAAAGLSSGIWWFVSERGRRKGALARALEEKESSDLAALAAEQEAASRLRFMATIGHEIRTPISGILGMAGHLLHTELNPSQREMVEIVQSSGTSLLSLLNDLLDYSKAKEGKLRLEWLPVALNRLVADCVALMASKAHDRGLELKVELPDRPVAVVADGSRLRQVILNLLGNAIKFTEEGSVVASLTTVPSPNDPTRSLVAISVEDTGIGIPPQRLESVFEAYEQAEADTTRRFGGTGLGLSISRDIVRALGGDIRLTSSVGQGSCFAVELELEMAVIEGEAVFREEGHKKPLLRLASALVVDDDRVNRMVVRKHLERAGVAYIQEAKTGAEGIQAATARSWDLVLMDVQMPDMDGLEAVRQVRAFEARDGRAPIPVLALSAHSTKEVEESCLQAGMDGFVTKPLTIDTLRAALSSWNPGGTEQKIELF